MRTLLTISLMLLLSLASAAADISGKWSGDVPGRGGDTMPMTFTFKVSGESLTGTVSTPQGEIPIQEGKAAGDQISFSTTLDMGGNTVKILYKGALSGDQLKMTRQREGGSGQPREFTLKRAAS